MRRPVPLLVVAVLASVAVASPAIATGRGGWSRLGVGSTATAPSLNGAVYALNTSNPGVLYAGGNFTSAGGNTKAQRVAKWSGSAWSALGTTPISNGAVFAIAYSAGKVYVGGTFTNAGGDANADYLAVFDGATWQPFCNPAVPGPAFTGNVNALQVIGNTLYVGGSFQNGAGMATADYLVGCDLNTGAATSTVTQDGDFSGSVYALTADSNGVLYAGGGFINLATIPEADHVAAYDGSWHAMGTGPGGRAVDDFVRSLAASGTNVFVGTDSVDVAGIAQADHVARWNGSSWSALGANSAGTNGWFPTSSFIYALAPSGSLLVAAGSFQNANGNASADNIAYFDGVGWRPLGSDGAGNGPFVGQATSLGITGGMAYVGGNFTSAGGDTLARFLAAHALRLPDAWIGAATRGPFVGDNVYSPVGSGEARNVTVTRGTSSTSYVKIQNDGIAPASFRVRGTGAATGFVIHWYGPSDITSRVKAGTYTTAIIAPGATVVLRFVVSLSRSTAASATFATTVFSQGGTPADAVRVAVRAR
jgi:hypothetical protein